MTAVVRTRAELCDAANGAREKFTKADDNDSEWVSRWQWGDPAGYRQWRREWLSYDRHTSIHEAAHAVLAVLAGHRVFDVSARSDMPGVAGHVRYAGPSDLLARIVGQPWLSMPVLGELAIVAAGEVAERFLGREHPLEWIEAGAASDRSKLDALYSLAGPDVGPSLRAWVFSHTYGLVQKHKRQIRAVARVLRRRQSRRMCCSDVLAAMGRAPKQLALFGDKP